MTDGLDNWLSVLVALIPQTGFELASKLATMAVSYSRLSESRHKELHPAYECEAEALTASSHVIPVHFQIIAAASTRWRS